VSINRQLFKACRVLVLCESMDETLFQNLGLSIGESKVYFALLKRGSCTVRDISKDAGIHRTNIYDSLEKLKEKGLVASYLEGKITKYKISDPNNLYNLINEKKDLLSSAFLDIEKIYLQKVEPVEVEVLKGKEGMKATFNDILRENKPMYAFGVKGQFREHLPLAAAQWMVRAKKQNLPYYGIYTKKKDLPSHYTEIRFLSEEFSSPVATFIYADKVNVNIWEPSLIAITIKSKLVAEMYKKHFDLLWKIAKKN
jgi:HTH-type transcriptional regulator, sugar sensing transcriptional regulator